MQRRNHALTLPLPVRRAPAPRRTASSSSEASHASRASPRSTGSEDQFVFSPAHSPANENPPPRVRVPRYATDPSAASGLLLGREVTSHPRHSENIPTTANHLRITPSSRSRPIAIHSPPASRARPATAAILTPEPLSARGDVPGGYFPLHEDPKSRVHVPHPFQLDSDMARQSSLRRAAESSKSSADPRSLSPSQASGSSHPSLRRLPSVSETDTPISSYIPSGLHDDVVLPMGKYYPSNWEKRHGKAPQQDRPPAPVIRSEPLVPKYNGEQAHPRPGSDVKRRLQQYQRDMVAQAAMAANALIASSKSADPATAASLSGVSLPKQLAATFLKTHKPVSPRLKPVGSPGPVTPMSLEAESYLSIGSSGGRGDGGSPGVEREGKGKHRRRDSRASSVELGIASV